MKPAKFSYHAPEHLEDALRLLELHGEEAKIIAGGQSLVPMMNLRLAQPEQLIDINSISALSGIEDEGDRIVFGALTRHCELLGSSLVDERFPILAEAARHIGHLAIRNRGTLGGSLSHADPAAEWPLMAILLDAELAAASVSGTRIIAAADFIQSIYTTDLAPEEILTAVSFPDLPADTGWSFRQISRRAGDFAIVTVAVVVRLDRAGAIVELRLGLSGMDAVPIRLAEVEHLAVGRNPDTDWIDEVRIAASQAGSPVSDLHAGAEYRRDVCATLTERALTEALSRTKGALT